MNMLFEFGVEECQRSLSLFDVAGREVASNSLLEQWKPLDPVIMTHLGARAS